MKLILGIILGVIGTILIIAYLVYRFIKTRIITG